VDQGPETGVAAVIILMVLNLLSVVMIMLAVAELVGTITMRPVVRLCVGSVLFWWTRNQMGPL
jgi:hypothetical protein